MKKILAMFKFVFDRLKFDPSNYFVYVTEGCLAVVLVLVLLNAVEKTFVFWLVTILSFALVQVFMLYHSGELSKK